MSENHQNKARSELIATETQLWLPSLSSKDREKVDQLRKKRSKSNTKRIRVSDKSIWDWLNLLGVLAIPFVVTVLGLYFTQQITLQQAQLGEKQHQTDLQIAADQQRETTLQTYLSGYVRSFAQP
jgi:hypothetical protein